MIDKKIITMSSVLLAMLLFVSPAFALQVNRETTSFNMTYASNTTTFLNLTNDEATNAGIVLEFDNGWFDTNETSFVMTPGESRNITFKVFGFRAGQYVETIVVNASSGAQSFDYDINVFVSSTTTFLCPPGQACLNETVVSNLLNIIASSANSTKGLISVVAEIEETRRNETITLIELKNKEVANLTTRVEQLEFKLSVTQNISDSRQKEIEELKFDLVWKGLLTFFIAVLISIFIILSRKHWKRFGAIMRDRLPIRI